MELERVVEKKIKIFRNEMNIPVYDEVFDYEGSAIE
jgi:hypothetical protein